MVRVPPLPGAPPEGERDRISARGTPPSRRTLVLYEDDEVLALNKPSGLAVAGGHQDPPGHIDRLLVGPGGEGMERAAAGAPAGPGHFRRSPPRQDFPAPPAKLAGAFAKRRTEKTYWALVVGKPTPGRGGSSTFP